MSKELEIYSYPSINDLEKLILENPNSFNKREGIIKSIHYWDDSDYFDSEEDCAEFLKIEAQYLNEKRGARFRISQSKIESLIKENIIKNQQDLIGKRIISYFIKKEKLSYNNLQNVKIIFD